jgi:LysR family transcriptional regulator, glycine cleavage system transcriptional activator
VKKTHRDALPATEALLAAVTAAQTGSFTATATALNLTHGAVSRRIAAVEHWAGFPMFIRQGRGVQITLAGHRLVERIEQSFAMLADGILQGDEENELPVIRVGVVQSFARLWLLPNLSALEGEPPDLRIEPDIENRYTTLSDARISIRRGRGTWPGVTTEPLYGETLHPVATPAIADIIGRSAKPQDILRWPLLHDLSEEGWQTWLTHGGESYRRRARDRFFDGYDLVLQACAKGMGIALARLPYGRSYIEEAGLMVLSYEGVTSPSGFHIVTRQGNRPDAMQRLITRMRHLAGLDHRSSEAQTGAGP